MFPTDNLIKFSVYYLSENFFTLFIHAEIFTNKEKLAIAAIWQCYFFMNTYLEDKIVCVVQTKVLNLKQK